MTTAAIELTSTEPERVPFLQISLPQVIVQRRILKRIHFPLPFDLDAWRFLPFLQIVPTLNIMACPTPVVIKQEPLYDPPQTQVTPGKKDLVELVPINHPTLR
ncbi:hypothetical protein TNIN_495611 [Trichonephila inaurata madagascariensis]|uniref:Uncharacterized protein n=1 Tax=Trichonephila inaurata madagascariensis TaxID=2747483 RepID=A0A8X6XR98_9ARAC|nr:hypothetical protein TNIN_495611 [Trichonephila inaurata madagascariensis]